MVKVEIKKQKENEVNLKIEIDKSKVNEKLGKVYNDTSYQIKIPGFRKGRIPKNILNLHLGKEYFYEKTAEELIPGCYIEAVKKADIEPINQPEIKTIQIEEDKPLIFEATVQVKPEVKLGSFDKISIQKEDIKITDSDVKNEIMRIQENLAQLKVVSIRRHVTPRLYFFCRGTMNCVLPVLLSFVLPWAYCNTPLLFSLLFSLLYTRYCLPIHYSFSSLNTQYSILNR